MYKLPELIKKALTRRTPLSRSHAVAMFQAGECTYPIYYQRVVNVDKGSVIIRYKLPELIKKVSQAGNPALPSHVSSMPIYRIRELSMLKMEIPSPVTPRCWDI